MCVSVLSLILALSPASAGAQPEKELKWPETWKMELDRPDADASKTWFVVMTPGWHVTTGPAAIFYDPGRQAGGNYRVESTVFRFPEGRSEGFGIFVGGTDLDKDARSYLALLIRRDGHFKIQVRQGADAHDLVPWTPHPAIAPQDGSTGKSVRNVLAIEARANEVAFSVNGENVNVLPRTSLNLDGIVGLRVNDEVNIHVSELSVEGRR